MNIEKWMNDFDLTIRGTSEIKKTPKQVDLQQIDLISYEKIFLQQIFGQLVSEFNQLKKNDTKDQEVNRCCDILQALLSPIKQATLTDECPNSVFIRETVSPYISLEVSFLNLLRSLSSHSKTSSETILKKTVLRILTRIDWILTSCTQQRKLDLFRRKVSESIEGSFEEVRYFEVPKYTEDELEMLKPLQLLTALLTKMQDHHKFHKITKSGSNTLKTREIPEVDTLQFYDGSNAEERSAKFMNMVEMAQDIEYRNKVFDHKNTILKAINDRNMGGEMVNLKDVMDKVESREYKEYKKTHKNYFNQKDENSFHEKTYEYLVIPKESYVLKNVENLDKLCDLAIDEYFRIKNNFALDKYFSQQFNKSEEDLLKRISKVRETRKNAILAETNVSDVASMDEENEDEAIRNYVRKKIIERKLLFTTRYWVFIDCLFSKKHQVSSLYLNNKKPHNEMAAFELCKLNLAETTDVFHCTLKKEALEEYRTNKESAAKKAVESYICEQPMKTSCILYFSKFCQGQLHNADIRSGEQDPEKLPNSETAVLLDTYRALAQSEAPDKVYESISGNKLYSNYTYITREEIKLVVRQFERPYLPALFT